MQVNLPWVIDPKTKEPSVSLTTLVISLVAVLAAIGLNIAKLTDQTTPALTFFATAAGLYFSRRIQFGGQVYGNDVTAPEDQGK